MATRKETVLENLRQLKRRVSSQKKRISTSATKTVNRKELLDETAAIADFWVENCRSVLEHEFKLPPDVIGRYAANFRQLHILARPSNLKNSHLNVLRDVLKGFDDDLVLPVQQYADPDAAAGKTNGYNLLTFARTPDPDELGFVDEINKCIETESWRAAVVLGWAFAIYRIRNKIKAIGYDTFNRTTEQLKNKKSGRFKRFNKSFSISTEVELQEIFDKDLIVILEGMELIDSNQAERLKTSYQYRCDAAHPCKAQISEPHLKVFFEDIQNIVLQNPEFRI